MLAAALLLGEYLVISHVVDAGSVSPRGGIWLLAAQLGSLGPLMVTTAAAWFMLFRLQPARFSKRANDTNAPNDDRETKTRAVAPNGFPWKPWLVVHCLSFGSLLPLTDAIFGRPVAPPGPAALWIMGWLVLTTGTAVSCLLGVLGGARWLNKLPNDLRVAGPVGVLTWLGGLASAALWPQCVAWTLQPTAALLQLFSVGARAHSKAGLLSLEHWTMRVSPGCSGHEGFGIVALLGLAYAVRYRQQVDGRRFLLALSVGLFAVWAVNVMRFASLGVLGDAFGARFAVASFHSKATWVLDAGLALLVVMFLRPTSRGRKR